MASLLVRMWKALTGEALPPGADAFDDDDGSIHEAAINALAEAGITTGTGDGYDPDAPVRRDQLASFFARMLGLLADDG